MNDIVKAVDSKTRVLVASIASASDVTQLASQVGSLVDRGHLLMAMRKGREVGACGRDGAGEQETPSRRICSNAWVSMTNFCRTDSSYFFAHFLCWIHLTELCCVAP